MQPRRRLNWSTTVLYSTGIRLLPRQRRWRPNESPRRSSGLLDTPLAAGWPPLAFLGGVPCLLGTIECRKRYVYVRNLSEINKGNQRRYFKPELCITFVPHSLAVEYKRAWKRRGSASTP